MTDVLSDLQAFLYKVEYMRGRQRAYFSTRNEPNLRMAKNAEKDVDQALGLLQKKGYKPVAPAAKPTQQTLM